MTTFTIILVGIVVLFGLLLIFRTLFSMQFCVLCTTAFTSWLLLLIFFYSDTFFTDPLFIAILMGGSIVGLMYLLEKKLPEQYMLFKLPYFITAIVLTYVVLTRSVVFDIFLVPLVLWVFAVMLFIGRDTKRLKAFGEKAIACCKNW